MKSSVILSEINGMCEPFRVTYYIANGTDLKVKDEGREMEPSLDGYCHSCYYISITDKTKES